MRQMKKLTKFGKEVAKLRIDEDISIQELSALSGFGYQTVLNMENGRTEVKPEYVLELALIFKLSEEQKNNLMEIAKESFFKKNKIDLNALSDHDAKLVLDLYNSLIIGQ